MSRTIIMTMVSMFLFAFGAEAKIKYCKNGRMLQKYKIEFYTPFSENGSVCNGSWRAENVTKGSPDYGDLVCLSGSKNRYKGKKYAYRCNGPKRKKRTRTQTHRTQRNLLQNFFAIN